MHPRPFLACFQVGTRKLLYGFVSMLVIGSMLLQPLTVVAVLYKHDAVLQRAIEQSRRLQPSYAANRPMAADRQSSSAPPLRTLPRLPLPVVRTEALADPTPSGAKPAYPLNHLLDANPQVVGTPPRTTILKRQASRLAHRRQIMTLALLPTMSAHRPPMSPLKLIILRAGRQREP